MTEATIVMNRRVRPREDRDLQRQQAPSEPAAMAKAKQTGYRVPSGIEMRD